MYEKIFRGTFVIDPMTGSGRLMDLGHDKSRFSHRMHFFFSPANNIEKVLFGFIDRTDIRQ